LARAATLFAVTGAILTGIQAPSLSIRHKGLVWA
jgi:hypothetical protein